MEKRRNKPAIDVHILGTTADFVSHCGQGHTKCRIEKICSITDIQCQAITIRLFDKSIWANLGDGRFIERQTGNIQPIGSLYRRIRTALSSGGVVFAKRKRRQGTLNWLPQPYKAKIW